MLSKEKLRKKFILLRKKKYFIVKQDFFKPLLKLIKAKKKINISLYYPSNYEVDTLNLFKILKGKKNLITSLPKLLSNGRMKFVAWNFPDPLEINKYGFLEPSDDSRSIIPKIMIVEIA